MDFHPQALLSPALRWSRPLAMTAALAWLAWALAQWTWQLLPAPSAAASPPPSPSWAAPKAMPSLAAAIIAAAPWGRAEVKSAEAAQDTSLPLTLRGVLAGEGLALIAASGQPERVFRLGDPLPGGAILQAVHEDHVLLQRDGRLERLVLPKAQLEIGAPPPSSSSTVPLRALLQGSPAELARHFRLQPVMEGGKLRGYRIHALNDPDLLRQAGLEADDVIVSINGRPLSEARDLKGLLDGLRQAATLDAVVLRNGMETPLKIDLNG